VKENGMRCYLQAMAGSEDHRCMFHERVEAKDERACVKALLRQLDGGTHDMEGYQLPGVDLSGRVFHTDVNLRNAVFAGPTSFAEASFPELVDLRGAHFMDDANFNDVRFRGPAHFSGAHFEGQVLLRGAIFGDDALFDEVAFGTLTDLDHARFAGDARFDRMTVEGRINLGYAEFDKYSFFIGAECRGESDFSFTEFRNYADLARSRWAELDMTDVIFEKRGCFDGAVISSGTFEDAELRHVTFRDVDLSNIFTTGASLEEAYMSEARWGKPLRGPLGKKVLVKEEAIAEVEGTRDAIKRAEAAHRNLKESYKNEGDYAMAGEFFIREMALRTRALFMDKEYVAWLANKIVSGLCGYGERPARVIFWWLAFVFVFGTIYFSGQLIAPSDGSGIDYSTWGGFLTCLYFSVVTFTTLGFGDIQPVTDAGRAVAGVEAFTGAFMIALFVLVLGRKMIR
jgi:uncharacterized protein YjbI with pentapeptide repeats